MRSKLIAVRYDSLGVAFVMGWNGNRNGRIVGVILAVMTLISGFNGLALGADSDERPQSHTNDVLLFWVKELVFTGNTVFTQEELADVVSGAAGREYTVEGLREVAASVTRHYAMSGYPLAEAYLPPQEIQDGVVEISVIEGSYGRVSVQNNAGLRKQVAQGLLDPLEPGTVIKTATLDRVIRLLNETPGVRARAELSRGTEPGAFDLSVYLAEGTQWTGSLTFDNFGNEHLGATRTTLVAELRNPRGWGDLASVQIMRSGDGLVHGRLAYSAPVNDGPLRVAVSGSTSRYDLVGPFDALDAEGRTVQWSLAAHYPYLRTSEARIDVGAGYDVRRMEGALFGDITTRRAGVARVRTTGERRINIFAGGVDRFSLSVSSGNLEILDPDVLAQDAAGAQTAGLYSIANGDFERTVALSRTTSLVGMISAQWASKNLHSSERFVLGGANRVRAYGAEEATGDEGWVARAEARFHAPFGMEHSPHLSLSAFVDAGGVRVSKRPWVDGPTVRTLVGVGVGLHYSEDPFQAKVQYAVPLTVSQTANVRPRILLTGSYRW